MGINSSISRTYVVSNKKLTAVAVMGVLLGMSVYIFMNSLLVGFDKSANESIFSSTSHIRVYKDDEISKVLISDSAKQFLIINPKVVPHNNTIINPKMVIATISTLENVTVVTPQVNSSVFINNGKSQIAGMAYGIIPEEANIMYDIKSTMVDGDLDMLSSNPNGIIVGSGIAQKVNLSINDKINLTSSKGVNRTFNVVGIFQSNNSQIDETKTYINLAASQQLLKESNTYITDINVNVKDPEKAAEVAKEISQITGYSAEGWKEANETMMASFRMRTIVITFVSFTILLVAGFGIYTILNMTVSQKINDIAILKAMGFKGKDVVRIFVMQALSIGAMGVISGVLAAMGMVALMKTVYIGGDVGYFPIDFEPFQFVKGALIGLVITFFAGYMPARKAANIDPVEILRK
jgi:lipoprotein-releasing system permease protein